MNDSPERCLISVGMPVFNEERFIRDSLEALVKQNYKNIELIISDNASEDGTEQICRDYASRYQWIRYHRNQKNIGAAANFSFVLDQSKGSYFMWAAGHDLWSPNYLSECVKTLEEHKGAAIAYGSSSWIDDVGTRLDRESGWIDTRGLDVVSRYFSVFWGNMHPILGVIRCDYLKKYTMVNTVGSDLILLTQLILRGDFIHAPGTHWNRREFRNENSYTDKLKRYESNEYGLAASRFKRHFPLIRLPFELILSVWRSNISFREKFSIMLLLIPALPVKYLAGRR